jgi:predicted nucleic acid-binding protein
MGFDGSKSFASVVICEQQFQALRTMRLRMGRRDLRIAATALVQNVVLITRNRRDFEQVPGLMKEYNDVSNPERL